MAVVGGGISGLYSAWSVLARDAGASEVLGSRGSEGLKVRLFELDGRLEDRLYSMAPRTRRICGPSWAGCGT